jgi:hypothetical protein
MHSVAAGCWSWPRGRQRSCEAVSRGPPRSASRRRLQVAGNSPRTIGQTPGSGVVAGAGRPETRRPHRGYPGCSRVARGSSTPWSPRGVIGTYCSGTACAARRSSAVSSYRNRPQEPSFLLHVLNVPSSLVSTPSLALPALSSAHRSQRFCSAIVTMILNPRRPLH